MGSWAWDPEKPIQHRRSVYAGNLKSQDDLKCKPAKLYTKCTGNAQLFLAGRELPLKSISMDRCCFLPFCFRKGVIAHPPFYCIKSSQVATVIKSLLGHLIAHTETSARPGGDEALVPVCDSHSQPRLPPLAILRFVGCCLRFWVWGDTLPFTPK